MRTRHNGTSSQAACPRKPRRARLRRLLKTLAWPDGVHLAAWAGLAISVSGCTTLGEYVTNGFKVGPNYTRPPAPVAPDWIDASDKRLRSESQENRTWWAVFNDPVMTALVNRAYQENLTVKQAGFRVLEARAQLQIAVGTFFPQEQSANGSFTRSVTSQTAANRSFLGQRYFSTWNNNFSLAWELDFWGRFRRSIESASDTLDASVENFDDALVTLVADTATTFVEIRTVESRILLAQENVELQKKNFDIAKAQFDAGKTSKIDQDQADADLNQTRALIPAFEITLRQANDHLCTLLGIPPRDLVTGLAAVEEVKTLNAPDQVTKIRPELHRLLDLFEKSQDLVLVKATPFAGNIPGRWAEWEALSDAQLKTRLDELRKEAERLSRLQDDLRLQGQLMQPCDWNRFIELRNQIDLGNLESMLRIYQAAYVHKGQMKKPVDPAAEDKRQTDFKNIVYAWQNVLGVGVIPVAPADVGVGIPAELLTRRPEVRRAERTAAAQCAQIGFADSEFYPHVSVIGTIGVESARLSHLYNQFSQQSAIGPAVQWNILNYGRIAGNVSLQDSTFQELVTVYQNTVLQANSEVEDGLIAFFKSREQAKWLDLSARAGADGVSLATVLYREGKIPFVALSTLQQQLVSEQDALAQAEGAIAQGLIFTYRALGGGWQIRLNGAGGPVQAPNGTVARAPLPGAPEVLPAPGVAPPDMQKK